MKLKEYNAENGEITLVTERKEIEDLILYLGHGRHAKALDYLNYENLGWKESAEISKSIRDEISAEQENLNDILKQIQ